MKTKIIILITILLLIFIPVFQIGAESLELDALIKNALEVNKDVVSAGYDIRSESLKYESVKSGTLPSLGFSTDTGNNPLYRFSNSNEFSTSTFTSERYLRHKLGGGLNLGINTPTGGSLSLTGSGNFDFSQEEDSDIWEYLISPSLSLYFRQPLFTDRINGSVLRFDSMKLADELAGLSLAQAEIAGTITENNLIIAIARTSVILNNLRYSYELLEERLSLGEKRLELAFQDEQAGRLSSLDRLAEELQIRRQKEALIEIDFQIDSAEKELENLSGLSGLAGKEVVLGWNENGIEMDVDTRRSPGVLSSEIVRRSVELAGTVVPNGDEPVFEVSSLLGSSDQDSAETVGEAFDELLSADLDFSISMSVSFSAFDWGEAKEKRESDNAALMAADARLEAAEQSALIQKESAIRNLQLIEEKFVLLKRGYEYDNSLLEREQVRFDAGLASELALETIKLDRKEHEYQIKQLDDEKSLALLELYNTGGIELKQLFE